MAAKKKKSTKKKVEAPLERSPFWGYIWAVALLLAAVFLLIGGFGTGGPLPINLVHAAYWTFGWVAYAGPVALGYWGIHKFIAEDNRIPASKLATMLPQ